MISLRQHAISIAAIFFALAIGIVLGSQTIASNLLSGLRDDKSDLQSQADTLVMENQQLRNQVDAGESFAGANAGRILANTLTDRTVVVVTTPDADPGDLDGVVRMVEAAGGKVTGKLALTESFLDTTSADRLRTTVTNVVPAGVQLRTGSVDQGSLSGDLLGSVLLLNAQSAQPQTSPQDAALALDALRSGGFVTYDDNSIAPGQLAVILTGDESGADGGNRGSVVARFGAAMDARGVGAVLAGRPGSALGSGPIAVTRADAALASAASSVDNVNMQTGRITVPLALAEQLDGISGRYGTGPNASAPTVGAVPS